MVDGGISFTVASIPEDAAPSDNVGAPEDSGYACEVCGTSLSYSGRGRPPKRCAEHKKSSSGSSTRSSGRRSSRDVEAAMAALDAAHTALSFSLMLMSPTAAQTWEANRPGLSARNQSILEGDPALAKRIASMAAKGGTTALVLNHLVAIVPVLGIVRAEARQRRANRMQQDASVQDVAFDFGPEYNPDLGVA